MARPVDGCAQFSGAQQPETDERWRPVFFYHSGKEKSVVGIAEVAKAAYPDPTAEDPQWVAVDLKP